MGAGWFAATALGVALAALCSHLLLLRPPFPSSAVGLEPELLELLRDHRPPALSETERQQYNATGLLVVRGALPAPVVSRLREILDDEPPTASPLFGGALSYVTSHAWTAYRGLRQLTAASITASLAAQCLGVHPTVRLVNSVSYGIGRSQLGADWHTDEISFRPVRRASPESLAEERGVSVWIPLQPIDSGAVGQGGGLSVVPMNTASPHCYAAAKLDAGSGRVSADQSAGVGRRECVRTLRQRGVSVGAMEPGDLLLFGRSVWHRTEPPTEAFPTDVRWSYTERFAPADAVRKPLGAQTPVAFKPLAGLAPVVGLFAMM